MTEQNTNPISPSSSAGVVAPWMKGDAPVTTATAPVVAAAGSATPAAATATPAAATATPAAATATPAAAAATSPVTTATPAAAATPAVAAAAPVATPPAASPPAAKPVSRPAIARPMVRPIQAVTRKPSLESMFTPEPTAVVSNGPFRIFLYGVEGVGKTLFEHYNSQDLAEAVVVPGDMSSLNEKCDKPEGHSYDKPAKGYTIYYGRDRGETDVDGHETQPARVAW